MRRIQLFTVLAGLSCVAIVHPAQALIVADAVVGTYSPGDTTVTPQFKSFSDPTAALGALQGDTGFGGMNPFNPPFSASQIVGISPGGELTLHMSSPVPTSGKTLGVFSNAGLNDASSDGSGQADPTAQTLDEAFGETDPEAVVKVSQDGMNFIALNGGNPILFTNPSNYYLNNAISNFDEPLGGPIADQSQPFLGTLSDFNGLTFAQIKQNVLNGSAGGNWLDLSGTGLAQVNYVRFDVPADATYGMVVDSVSAVPEPVIGLPLLIAAGALLRRRQRLV
jgi:hypothetical protein